jgi:hypothetical protein
MGAVILTFLRERLAERPARSHHQTFRPFQRMGHPPYPAQAVANSRARLLHLICTSRVHPGRGKGISHLAVEFDPNITLFCPTERPRATKKE